MDAADPGHGRQVRVRSRLGHCSKRTKISPLAKSRAVWGVTSIPSSYPRIYFGQPEKGMSHRALADIKESIRELKYYRATAFVPQPGPTTDEVRAAAGALPPVD